MGEFSRRKPTEEGRYKWRLPESEKRGYYTIDVKISPGGNGEGLVIYGDEGDVICALDKSHGGSWMPATANALAQGRGD